MVRECGVSPNLVGIVSRTAAARLVDHSAIVRMLTIVITVRNLGDHPATLSLEVRLCKRDGFPFIPREDKHVFCSDRCYQQDKNERRKLLKAGVQTA